MIFRSDILCYNCRYWHTLYDKHLDHMLVNFVQNRVVCYIQNFELFGKKWLTIFEKVFTPFWKTFLCHKQWFDAKVLIERLSSFIVSKNVVVRFVSQARDYTNVVRSHVNLGSFEFMPAVYGYAVGSVSSFFHQAVGFYPVYCNFTLSYTCRDTVIFGTWKDWSLFINTVLYHQTLVLATGTPFRIVPILCQK